MKLKTKTSRPHDKCQQGSTLVEVLVALFVLAIGMLGYMSLITSGMTINQRAFTLSQAVFLAEDYADRARANRDAISNYRINAGQEPADVTDCDNTLAAATACTENELAAWDKEDWWNTLNNTLVNGDAQVDIDTSSSKTEMIITIFYSLALGKAGTGDSGSLVDLEQHQLITEI